MKQYVSKFEVLKKVDKEEYEYCATVTFERGWWFWKSKTSVRYYCDEQKLKEASTLYAVPWWYIGDDEFPWLVTDVKLHKTLGIAYLWYKYND